MIVIFFILLTAVFAKQEEYIDRLPNEEEFLNEIERRMMSIDDYVDQLKEDIRKGDTDKKEGIDNHTHINQENTTSGDLAVKPLNLNKREYTYNFNESPVKTNQNLSDVIVNSDKNISKDNSNVIFINNNKSVKSEETTKAIQSSKDTATYEIDYVPIKLTGKAHSVRYERTSEDKIATTKNYQTHINSPIFKTVVTNEKPMIINQKLVKAIAKLGANDVNDLYKTNLETEKIEKQNPIFIEKKYLSVEDDEDLKHYKVYEVPWPNNPENPPFFSNPDIINEPQLDVPFLKYYPKHSYYNTDINLRSNNKNNTSQEIKTNDDDKYWWVMLLKHLMILLLARKNQYYLASDLSQLKKTSSNKRLSRSLKDDLKSHIRTVRDLFKNEPTDYYANPISDYKYINSLNEYKKILDKYKRLHQLPIFRARSDCLPDIDIDYYFGRMNRRHKKCKTHMAHQLHNHKKSHKKRHQLHFLNHLVHYILHNNIGNHGHFIFGKRKPKKLKNKKHKYTNHKIKSDLPTESKNILVDSENNLDNDLKNVEDTNIKSKNEEFDVNIETYMKVLKDIILQDNKALKQYDWLKTTVEIQQTLFTMTQIIQQMKESSLIHSEDIEFLKHAVFINNLSSDIKKINDLENEMKHINETKNRMEKNEKIVKVNNLVRQKRINLRSLLPDLTVKDELSVLYDFLLEVQDGLYDLHEALMNIAKVTQFDNQHWYDNLKELYLTSDEKHLREILLHISFSRLLDLVENGRQNGLQDDFVTYVKNNRKESKRIVQEIVFVSKILDEIKTNVN